MKLVAPARGDFSMPGNGGGDGAQLYLVLSSGTLSRNHEY